MQIIHNNTTQEQNLASDDSVRSIRCLIADMVALADRLESFNLAFEIGWQKRSLTPETQDPETTSAAPKSTITPEPPERPTP